MGKYEYKYNYSDWYLQTQIQIQILLHKRDFINIKAKYSNNCMCMLVKKN